jgi:hypothetical protein
MTEELSILWKSKALGPFLWKNEKMWQNWGVRFTWFTLGIGWTSGVKLSIARGCCVVENLDGHLLSMRIIKISIRRQSGKCCAPEVCVKCLYALQWSGNCAFKLMMNVCSFDTKHQANNGLPWRACILKRGVTLLGEREPHAWKR